LKTIETEVLVVGAGPVGLQTALELGWRGISCLVIEQGDRSNYIVHPRAAAIGPRTMEFCRRWGFVQEVIDCGFPKDYELSVVYCTSLCGHLLDRHSLPSIAELPPLEFSPQNKQRCPQIWFDPILERNLQRFPSVQLQRPHRLERFDEEPAGVRAQVTDLESKGRYEVRARYMVACDGADSPVREALGIGIEGDPTLSYSINIIFRVPGFRRLHDKGDAERYILVGPQGTWGNITVIDGRDNWRVTLIGNREKQDLSSLDAHEVVRRALGADLPFEVVAVTPWRRREQTARHMQKGRVFLAGDAVHAMSPTGGFGMNTGAADAVDIGWKLAAVLRGWGDRGLLATYEIERKPVALRNTREAAQNFHLWLTTADCSSILDETAEGESLRRRVGGELKKALAVEWDAWGIHMGYRYEGSPICVADGTAAPPDDPKVYVQSARPGSRAPHAWLDNGASTLDLFGRGFVLLRFGRAAPDVTPLREAARRRAMPLDCVDIEEPHVAALYEQPLVLVRPDGHVAWRGEALPADVMELLDTVRGARVDKHSGARAHGLAA
jgi:2-polyprenyl-6-methoxyphenol hydroxylase-like FAD-dependent oxidoreductase